jgi:hypothetical protein
MNDLSAALAISAAGVGALSAKADKRSHWARDASGVEG